MRLLSHVFGNNKSVVDSNMTPNGKTHKRHVALSFHRIRESVAAGIVNHQFIDRKSNPSDVLSEHWAHNNTCPSSSPSYFGQETLWRASMTTAWNKVMVRFGLEFSFVFVFVFSFMFWVFMFRVCNVLCLHVHACLFVYQFHQCCF